MTSEISRVKTILSKHFSKVSSPDQLDKIAGEIAILGEDWEEIPHLDEKLGAGLSVQCEDICHLGELYHKGVALRVFRKKSP